MAQSDIGLIGLAVMGQNLVLNMESRGYTVSVFNRNTAKVDEFLAENPGKKLVGAHSIEEFVKSLKGPRKIMMMVKAGRPSTKLMASSTRSSPPRHPHRRRKQLLPRLEPPCRRSEGQGLSPSWGPVFRGARKVPSRGRASCRGRPVRLAAHQGDLSEDFREGRSPTPTSPAANGSVPAVPALRQDGA